MQEISLATVLKANNFIEKRLNRFSFAYIISFRDCFFYRTIAVAAFEVNSSIRK